jgi:phage regulator Rha-like protein
MSNANIQNSIIELVENEPRVSHRVIAEHTNNQEVSVRNLINKYREKFEKFGNLHFKNEGLKRATKDGKSRGEVKNVTYYCNEPQSTFLMTLLKNSETVVDFKLRLVEEFFTMREMISQGKQEPQAEVSKISEKERLENNLLALKFAQDNLAVSDEDRTRMARKMFDTFGLDTSYFPDFVDGKASFSLSQLLRQNGVKMSAVKVNALLQADGLIEKKFRDSSKTKLIKDENGEEKEVKVQKQFWSITKAGEEFGKNVVSTHGSSTETQVRFFEEKFMELLEKLEIDCNCQKS